MKPVNLIPADQRRNATVAGRSGGAAYVLLGVLAIAVVVALAYTVSVRSIADKRADLADKTAQAQKLNADAQRFGAYTRFSQLRKQRTETVLSIARSRFDWARAMREVARTLPSGVSLTSMTGSVTPGVSIDGGATDPLRSASQSPALVLVGCASGQGGVAKAMVDLRRMEGVERVALSSSEKGSGPTTSGGSGASCASKSRPSFSMVVFYKTPATTTGASSTTGSAPTTSPSTASTGASK